VFWVISVYFNIRNTLPKSGTFLLFHPVYIYDISSLRGNREWNRWTRCWGRVNQLTIGKNYRANSDRKEEQLTCNLLAFLGPHFGLGLLQLSVEKKKYFRIRAQRGK